MVAAAEFLVFALALGFSVGVIVAMVAPQWQRIARLATGHVEPDFQPLMYLARAERRIVARRRMRIGGPAPIRQREAA